MSPCKNAWLPFARVATPGLFSAAKNAPFFSHKSTAANLEMRFNLIRGNLKRFPARCQLGRVGSCVTTMAALAAQIHRNTYTYHIRATYVALRLSAVQNPLQARLNWRGLRGLARAHASSGAVLSHSITYLINAIVIDIMMLALRTT